VSGSPAGAKVGVPVAREAGAAGSAK